MSTIITTRLERRVEADPSGMTVTDTTDGQSIMVALTRAQACELAAALDPGRDFSGVDWKSMYEHEIRNRVEAVDRAARAERERDEALRVKGEMVDRAVRAERERDAAVARAEQAENARDTVATRAAQLEKKLAKVMSDYQDVEDERDVWKARAEAAEARTEEAKQLIPAYAMLDVWGALGRDSIHFDDWYDDLGYADAWAELVCDVRDCAEAVEARTVPAVTHEEIERFARIILYGNPDDHAPNPHEGDRHVDQ